MIAARPPEVLEFLAASSLLERFRAPLCDHVLGERKAHLPGAAETIARRQRENLFLVERVLGARESLRWGRRETQESMRSHDPNLVSALIGVWRSGGGTGGQAVRQDAHQGAEDTLRDGKDASEAVNRRSRAAGRRDFAQRARSNPFLLDHGPLGSTVPIHPFADEADLLERIGSSPQDCRTVDAWWLIRGREVFLQVEGCGGVAGVGNLVARWHRGLLYLAAGIEESAVRRCDFERVLAAFLRSGVFGRRRLG